MRNILLFILLVGGIIWMLPSQSEPETDPQQDIVSVASGLVGSPYRAGGRSPAGFDCSGFTSYVFEQMGKQIPRDSRSQALSGEAVSLEAAQPGDLIFFKGSDLETDRIGHSALVVGGSGQEVEVIHACNRGVVKEKIFDLAYYRDRFVTIRRM